MMFEEYVKEGKVIKGAKDIQKAKALLRMSENNLKTAEKIDVTDVTSSAVFGIVYESLREVIEAMCLIEGWKVYSHEAFTAYLKDLGEDAASEKFDRLRKLRNGANYYGKAISVEVTQDAKQQAAELCRSLKKKYLNDVGRATI